ncbi:hypothetical protein GCM10022276_11810 [Sphingomonas limnosediminicola]|uniref:Uncharacterized protein n=1 Tax=Sphingomonas limnosediminicola TaxID=940133 RepID=A0ABP7L6U8_9SPHN
MRASRHEALKEFSDAPRKFMPGSLEPGIGSAFLSAPYKVRLCHPATGSNRAHWMTRLVK